MSNRQLTLPKPKRLPVAAPEFIKWNYAARPNSTGLQVPSMSLA